jgi:hypothetical protein
VTPISAVIVVTGRQPLVASRYDVEKSGAGTPGSLGSFISAGAQAEPAQQHAATTHVRIRPSRFRGKRYFFSFWRAERIFLSMSARSIESPSPESARLNAAIASSYRPSFSSTSP